MSAKQLWELGEIYTSPLNLFLILLGVSYSRYENGSFFNGQVLLYILLILFFHIAVNVFNNYMDYLNASDEHEYKTKTNIIGRENLSLKTVRTTFIIFLAVATLLGVLLAWQTNWVLLVLGLIGFYIGLFYSAGPKPLNSLPIAETVTSLASGFFVPLVGAYLSDFIHTPLTIQFVGKVLLVCLPTVLMMFNNLLANNTCDLEEDIVNGRKTLVYYLGKARSVTVTKITFLFSFVWLFVLAFLGLAPWTVLLLVVLLPKSWKNLQAYFHVQDKQKTFPIVLKALGGIMIWYPVLYCVGSFLPALF